MNGLLILKRVMNVVGRVVFLYLVVMVGFFLFTDYKTVVRSAQLQTLSRLTPSFDYYQEFFRDPAVIRPESLQECLYYHKTVADLVPAVSGAAWSVAGFCAYQLGQKNEAISFMEKAMAKNPVFFWDHYNLGIMAFNEGDYERAGNFFSQAIHLDPRHTLYILDRSKIYTDIVRSFKMAYGPQQSLVSGYARAGTFLRVSIACHANSQAPSCQERPKLYPQIF